MENASNFDKSNSTELLTSNYSVQDFEYPPQSLLSKLRIPRKVHFEIPDSSSTNEDSNINSEELLYSVNKPHANKQYYHCKECKIIVSSQLVLDSHLGGAKHAKKIKELETSSSLRNLQKEHIRKEERNVYKCDYCNISCSSLVIVKNHIQGHKHQQNKKLYQKLKVLKCRSENVGNSNNRLFESYDKQTKPVHQSKAQFTQNYVVICNSASGSVVVDPQDSMSEIPSNSSVGDKKNQEKQFCCSFCNVNMNSQKQYNEHIGSKKHLTKIEKEPYCYA